MEFLIFKKAPDTHGIAAKDFKSVVSAETPYGGAELGRGKFGPKGDDAVTVRRASLMGIARRAIPPRAGSRGCRPLPQEASPYESL